MQRLQRQVEPDRGVLATSVEDLTLQLVTDAGPHSDCQVREGCYKTQCQQDPFDSSKRDG